METPRASAHLVTQQESPGAKWGHPGLPHTWSLNWIAQECPHFCPDPESGDCEEKGGPRNDPPSSLQSKPPLFKPIYFCATKENSPSAPAPTSPTLTPVRAGKSFLNASW